MKKMKEQKTKKNRVIFMRPMPAADDDDEQKTGRSFFDAQEHVGTG